MSALLNRFFVHRLGQADPLTPAARALRLLVSGQCSVGTVAARVGIGERQLER